MNSLLKIFFAFVALSIAGCAGSAKKSNDIVAVYDFGVPTIEASAASKPSAAKPSSTLKLYIPDAQSNSTFDSNALIYRLPANQARAESYAYARWSAPPATLLSERIRVRAQQRGITIAASEAEADRKLVVELIEFSHVFTGEKLSDGLLLLRATLYNKEQAASQRFFEERLPAPSHDAFGGAIALTQASEKAISRMLSEMTP
jgi:cholesterol transport system auxiliary component